MAIPRHRGWHLEDFIKQHIHQDANVLDVGGDNAIKLKLILQHKGLKLRRKTGVPIIKVGGELHLFADKSQDLVVLDRVPNIDDEALLKEAARISRKHVLIQTYIDYFGGLESWLEKLSPLGQHLITFLPLHTSDDLATPENPPALIVLDVSQAPAEQDVLFDEISLEGAIPTEPGEDLINKVKEARLHSQISTSHSIHGTPKERPLDEKHFSKGVASLKEAAERARANLTDKEREVLDERFRLSGGISEKAESINQRPPEGPSVHNSEAPPADPDFDFEGAIPTAPGESLIDAVADSRQTDPVLDLAERAVSLEEQLLGRAVRSSFPSKVPNPPLTDELPSAFGSLMDGLSLSELDLLSKCAGISIPQRNGLDESLEDYGNRVRALIELSIQEGIETPPPLTEQEKLLSAELKQKFQHFWDLVVLEGREPA